MTKKTLQEEKRERYLKNLINEAIINILAEQDEMQITEPEAPVIPAPTPEPMPTAPTDLPADGTGAAPAAEEFTVDTMVKKLNVLRGGKSLKDPEVFGQLTTFFNNLTDDQKTSMQWLLDELTKVVAVPETEQSVGPQTNMPQPITTTPAPQPTPAPAPAAPTQP